MSKRESIARCNLIINKLRNNPASFNEISDYLEKQSVMLKYDYNISKRTFHRDVADIRSWYNIHIEYDSSRKVYYIDDEDQSDLSGRVLEAFDTFQALNFSTRLSNYIHFEKRKPSGTENLNGLLHAIENHLQISFSYQKFRDDAISNRLIEPYALKEFKNRWYVLGREVKSDSIKIKTFSLDRLSELGFKKKFTSTKTLDVNEYLKSCFGIVSPSGGDFKLEEIVLSFDPHQGKYVKTLPWHKSQEILIDNETELRIKLKLYLTADFMMELLSYGEYVTVIQPQSLIENVKRIYTQALKRYE